MRSQILSLNLGEPAPMEWEGKSIVSSMFRRPVPGPIIVHPLYVEGNGFAAPNNHGGEHAVLYLFGMKSALEFAALLKVTSYEPGAVGETITLDDFDEKEVGLGDRFRIGEVEAEATFPRIPCAKVNFRMQNGKGQDALQDCGRSGVYLRVLKPGAIHLGDTVERIFKAEPRFSIFELYAKLLNRSELTNEDRKRAVQVGALPRGHHDRWAAELAQHP